MNFENTFGATNPHNEKKVAFPKSKVLAPQNAFWPKTTFFDFVTV